MSERRYNRSRNYSKNYRCPSCSLEFKSEGVPRHCPRCHSVIEIKENNRR
jgi:rubrerythrin